MPHLGNVGGVSDGAQIGKSSRCRSFRPRRDGRLQRRHDLQSIRLAEWHEAHGDRDLAMHGGREKAEQCFVKPNPMRRGNRADGDGVGQGCGRRA